MVCLMSNLLCTELLPWLAVPASLEADRGRVHQEPTRREYAQEEQPRLQNGGG